MRDAVRIVRTFADACNVEITLATRMPARNLRLALNFFISNKAREMSRTLPSEVAATHGCFNTSAALYRADGSPTSKRWIKSLAGGGGNASAKMSTMMRHVVTARNHKRPPHLHSTRHPSRGTGSHTRRP